MARKVLYIIIKSETTVFLNSCCAACCGPPPAEDVGGARAPAAVAKVCAWRGAAVAANCSASVKARWPGRRRVASLEAPLQRLQQNIAEYRNFESHTKECFPEVEKDEKRKLEELSGLTEIGELHFHTSESGNGQISLQDYVDRMNAEQESIFFIKGRDFIDVEGSLAVEVLRTKGCEVVYLLDPVAKATVGKLKEFNGKRLVSVLEEYELEKGCEGKDWDRARYDAWAAAQCLLAQTHEEDEKMYTYSEEGEYPYSEGSEYLAVEEEEEEDEYMQGVDDDEGDESSQ